MNEQQKIQIGFEFVTLYHKKRDLQSPLSSENDRMMKKYCIENNYSIQFLNECKELYFKSITNR